MIQRITHPRLTGQRRFWPAAKRIFDLTVALFALVLLSPLLLVLALLVRLDSPGPSIFSQERVGQGFRRFRVHKFRTMHVDAPSRGPQITVGDDARITRVGRILRRTKLDELPQLWNVLCGEMSIVGPRPEVPAYVDLFRHDYEELLTMRPGLTDPASLVFHDEAAVLARAADPQRAYTEEVLPQKIALSRQYVRCTSLHYDLQLILLTLVKVVQSR